MFNTLYSDIENETEETVNTQMDIHAYQNDVGEWIEIDYYNHDLQEVVTLSLYKDEARYVIKHLQKAVEVLENESNEEINKVNNEFQEVSKKLIQNGKLPFSGISKIDLVPTEEVENK